MRQEVITCLTNGNELEEGDLYKSLESKDFIGSKPIFIKIIQPN